MYLSEMTPTTIRGALLSLNQLMIMTGILLAYIVNYIFAASEGWRWMLGVAFILGILVYPAGEPTLAVEKRQRTRSRSDSESYA